MCKWNSTITLIALGNDTNDPTTTNTFLITLYWDTGSTLLEERKFYLVLANTSNTLEAIIMNEEDDINILPLFIFYNPHDDDND